MEPRHERVPSPLDKYRLVQLVEVSTEVSNSLKVLMIFIVSVGGLVSNDEENPELGFLLELIIPPDQQPEKLGCA